jgi:nucleoside-diphosphate-sugar epimerase
MDEQVIVLGAAGFIGRALCRHLKGDCHVVGVDLAWGEPGPDGPDERVEQDVTELGGLDRLLAERAADRPTAAVVDLVAHYDFLNSNDPRYERVESGLAHLIEEFGARFEKDVPFLYASSMASVGPTQPGEPLTESSPRAAPWAYPAHKLRCEKILEAAEIPQPRVELVLAGVYSAWCELVPLYFQLERLRTGSLSAHVYPGPVDRGLTYIHVDDVARAFAEAAIRLRGHPGVHRYMIGESKPATYADIHRIAAEGFRGRPGRLMRVPRPLAKTGAAVLSALRAEPFIRPWMIDFAGEHFELDLTKSRRELDFEPSGYLLDRLPDIVERARKDPDRWTSLNEARPR